MIHPNRSNHSAWASAMLLLLSVLSTTLLADENLRQKVKYAGDKYYLAYNTFHGNVFMAEYLPRKQTLDNWTELLAHRTYPLEKSVPALIAKYFQQVTPTQTPSAFANPDKTDVTLVFLVEAPDKSHMEFNIHRFVLERSGINSYQFAARASRHEQLLDLHKRIVKRRAEWMEDIFALTSKDFLK